ncbi:MAG: NAD(P)-dependent oxidoreductase [Nitrospinota bacterium]
MGKVILVDPLFGSPQWNVGKDWLGAENEVVRPSAYTPEAIHPLLPGAEGILTVFKPVTAPMMDAAPRLRVVAKPGAGVDNIDMAAATRRGVMVCNAEGVRGLSVAEHAFFMMLYLGRHAWMRDDWKPWEHTSHVQLGGKSLGIVGLGDIGRRAARIGHGFGMKVLVNTRTPDPAYVPGVEMEFLSFEALLPRADFLILCMPLVPQTKGMIRAGTLARMKRTAILINVSRGPAVATDDLAEAIRSGAIAGAGLDVTDPEPLPDGHPLRSFPNVLITPHHASRTPECQQAAMDRTAENLRLALAGRRPVNLVNPETFPPRRG